MILVDAGPLAALVDAGHIDHRRCVAALQNATEPLATTWPVLAEALNLLTGMPKGQDAVWEMFERRAVTLLALAEDELPRVRALMATYAKRKMSAAHATLVRVAEREGTMTVFTLERKAFEAYRIGRRRFRVVPK